MANTKKSTTNNTKTVKPSVKKRVIKFKDDMIVNVKSNVTGSLLYINPKSGLKISWGELGEVQPMEIAELRVIKNSAIKFYQNQWIIFDSVDAVDEDGNELPVAELYKYLNIENFYKDLIDPDNFDQILQWSESQILDKVSKMTSGAKENLLVKLNEMIISGKLDSLRSIKSFEKALNCELDRPE